MYIYVISCKEEEKYYKVLLDKKNIRVLSKQKIL